MEKYKDRRATPLGWHAFTRFVRVPLGVVLSIYFGFSLLRLGINDFVICFLLMELLSVVLLILFFVGAFNWKRYAWQAIVAFLFYDVFLSFCTYAITYVVLSKTIAFTLGVTVLHGIDFIYYEKRECLFDDNKFDASNVPAPLTIRDTNTSTNVLYCRRCGTRLDQDAMFCKRCGTRIEGD